MRGRYLNGVGGTGRRAQTFRGRATGLQLLRKNLPLAALVTPSSAQFFDFDRHRDRHQAHEPDRHQEAVEPVTQFLTALVDQITGLSNRFAARLGPYLEAIFVEGVDAGAGMNQRLVELAE